MLDCCKKNPMSWFFGCLACLLVTSVVNADGRVFVVSLRNSSHLDGFREAERACASHQARLASAHELHHAVSECFFSSCTRGWLYGGSVGTTVCNVVGGALKAVDVRTENATEDGAHLNAFCIEDRGVPCGDPPSFPNARLQGHSGYEMGDELLYTCVPGYLMPSGHKAFSLLCDSCGEWYGLVEICVKDETEGHIDYEDKFTDSYEESQHQNERPAEAHGEVHEEVHGAANLSQTQQETSYDIESEEEHQDRRGKHEVEGEVIGIQFEGGEKDEERPVEDFIGHPGWEEERREVVTTDATQAPVSLLSQKHLFWFPSEAFEEEGHPVSTNPSTQSTQKASGGQSEESKEQESQEGKDHLQHPVDDHEDVLDDGDDHNDSIHHDKDANEDSRHDDQDDPDSHQEEDNRDDHVKHYIPAQHDRKDRTDDRDDHYDMGEHEDERDRIHYGAQEYDDRDDTYDEHESYEDHEDLTDDHDKDDQEHLDDRQNITQKATGGKATTDDTWLDGYPVVQVETEKDDSTTERLRPEDEEKGTVIKTSDKPNEVEFGRPVPYTNLPEISESPTDPSVEQTGIEEMQPGFSPSPAPSKPSDSPSYPDTQDYDTQQVAPTHSWLGNPTEHPYLDQDQHPPMQDNDILSGVIEEHTLQDLPGEAGERGEMEGEIGEAMCPGENCTSPPPSSSNRGPTVAAIIAIVCMVAAAVIIGVWCYRRQQQKSSMYEMNGKGQSQSRQGQHIEMQQKV
ncbi:sushi domain-containing protein 5 isoform X1 [Xyrichtys novacula]|uniref:Sushi domain-containing protein 5 isoform X1 n=1 Tax=Xyrichtys novacula TaxID=13765 RepID=A0AAV1HE23_XYRNO|nr:sushi domain-containing protein 5 isoform X1 [Xyrichtys novacula]